MRPIEYLRIEYRPVKSVSPYPGSPRTHSKRQIGKIASGIEAPGWANPILVDCNENVLAGHGRLLGARMIGLNKVPVVRLDHLIEAQRSVYALADNRRAENAVLIRPRLEAETGETAVHADTPESFAEMAWLRTDGLVDV